MNVSNWFQCCGAVFGKSPSLCTSGRSIFVKLGPVHCVIKCKCIQTQQRRLSVEMLHKMVFLKINLCREYCSRFFDWKIPPKLMAGYSCLFSVCSGGWLHHEESFFSSEVSTVWLLPSREWRNAQTYVYQGQAFTRPTFLFLFWEKKLHAML